ncbi:hypothetical protein ABZ871_40535 [Streptomyces populi]
MRTLQHHCQGQAAGVLGVHRILQQLLATTNQSPSQTDHGRARTQRVTSRRTNPS